MFLRAMVKRIRSKDGEITLSRRALLQCAGREQLRHARKIARAGAEAGLWTIVSESAKSGETVIVLPNWAKEQNIAPVNPQVEPDEAPDTETKTHTDIETQTDTKTETDSRKALREVKGAGGPKPTRTSRCSCPENLTERDLKAAREFLDFEKPEFDLSDEELAFGWGRFRERASGNMDREKWIIEFGIWLSGNWPLEGLDIAKAG